jgi:hypothetical protein
VGDEPPARLQARRAAAALGAAEEERAEDLPQLAVADQEEERLLESERIAGDARSEVARYRVGQ